MAQDGITVATSLAYSKLELKRLNGLTFLFNPKWDSKGDYYAGGNTLPMSLLHIVSMTESGQSQISNKQMLLYREDTAKIAGKNVASVSAPVTAVVADNIINQPKTYQIDAILPDKFDSLQGSPLATDIETQIAGVTDVLLKNDYRANITNPLTSTIAVISQVSQIMNIAISIMRTLIVKLTNIITSVSDMQSFDSIVASVVNGSQYNKHSLEAMWHSRAILKLKLPNSWKYKTVVITGCSMSKNGAEDNCTRLNLTLQEVSVVSTKYYTGSDILTNANTVAVQTLGNELVTWIEKADASGATYGA
jgi:hypothetical protein